MQDFYTKEAVYSLAKIMATIFGLSHLLSVSVGALRNRARPYIDATFTQIVKSDGSIDVDLLTHLAEAIGLTFEQLSNGETQHVIDISEKYMDFFENYIRFTELSMAGCRLPNIEAMQLAYAGESFDETKANIALGVLQNRIAEELKHIDDDIVKKKDGCEFIEIGYIKSFKLCEFEGIVPMLKCYLVMIQRVKSLFEKALQVDLTQDEVTEYNILVTATGMKDPYYRPIGLYYSTLQKLKPVYLAENFTSKQLLFREDLEPWRAIQFVQNPELAEHYLQTVPQAKKYLSRFSKVLSNFRCYFRWVDKPCEEYWQIPSLNDEPNEYDDSSEYVKFDLPKTAREQLGQTDAIEALSELSHNYPPEQTPEDAMAMKRRYDALHAEEKL